MLGIARPVATLPITAFRGNRVPAAATTIHPLPPPPSIHLTPPDAGPLPLRSTRGSTSPQAVPACDITAIICVDSLVRQRRT